MRRLLVLTSALALVGCSDFVVEPNATANRDFVVGPRRFVSGVTWTLSSTNVDMIALGRFDGRDTYPLDVNDSRQVVGHYYLPSGDDGGGSSAHAFIWEDGVFTDLGTLGGSVSFAHQISNSGVIVGWSYNSNGQRRPVVWRNGVISELPAPAGEPEGVGSARAINSNGDIVGHYGKNAVKWTSAGAQIVGVLPGAETSEAFAINGQGDLFGSAFNTAVKLPWRWSSGTFTELTLPERGELSGALMESGRVFNDAGHFLGTLTDEQWNTRAFVHRDGAPYMLPHPSGNYPDGYTVALGLNEAGDVAGLDLAGDWTWRAVVWPRTGAPVDLGHAPGDFMSRASGINNGIFAVGASYDAAGNASGVLWKWLVDRTSPVVSGSVQGTLGPNGYYVSNVDVSWTVSDVESSIKSSEGCGPASISADSPGMTLTCTVTNNVDLTTSATVTFKRDVTPPSVMYVGNAGTYGVDATIAIMCSPSDATSGIDTHTCQPISGEALAFGIGRHTFSATATDRAGHSASGSTAFTVELTLGGLAGLTRRYSTNANLGEALAKLLEFGAIFRAHGNTMASELVLRAYTMAVQAQIGKAFTSARGAVLLELSKTFLDTRASRAKPKSSGHRGRR